MQLLTRNYVDGTKPDTPQGVNVANFQTGTGNLWDCLQSIGAGVWSVTAGSVNYTVANAGLSLIDASGGNVTINLPQISSAAAALAGSWFQFKRVDSSSNTVTINRGGTDTIDGAPSFNLVGQYDFQEIRCDGASAWRQLNAFANGQRARDLIAAGVLSCRNKVRNPKMDIITRGATFAAAAFGAYTIDGWQWQGVGSHVATLSQQADVMAGSDCQSSLRVNVTTANAAPAAGNFAAVEARIEGYLVRDLQGNPIALQFQVKSPKTGTHCVALANSGSDRSYILTYNVAAANTWQLVTLALPAGLITAGTWNWTTGIGLRLYFVLMAGSTYQSTAGAWQTGNFLATAAQVNCVDTVGNIFAVTGVQLEKAGASTPLEHRDIATETMIGRRYLRRNRKAWGYCATANSISISEAFEVPMRATPSASLLTTTPYAEQPIFVTPFNGSGSAIANTHLLAESADISITGYTGLTVGAMAMFDANQVQFSAEL